MYYTQMTSPIGNLVLTSDGTALTAIYHQQQIKYKEAQKTHQKNDKKLAPMRKQLEEYFNGKRKTFDIALAPEGTSFQKKVWRALQKISYGDTTNYGAIAKTIKNPKASRAVGAANGKNPLPFIVPCHRVIGASGELTGYTGGLKMKQWLLTHEEENKSKG